MTQCEITYFDGNASVNCVLDEGHEGPHRDAADEWNATGDLHARVRLREFRCGAAVAFGLMGMAEAIRGKLWNCDHCHRPDDPNACCRGQNFIPADVNGPWICWMCGADENAGNGK